MYYTTQHTAPYILPYLMQYILSYTTSYTSTFHVKHFFFYFKYIILFPHIILIISYIPNIVSPCYNYHIPLFPSPHSIISTTIQSSFQYYISNPSLYTILVYILCAKYHIDYGPELSIIINRKNKTGRAKAATLSHEWRTPAL